MKNDSLEELMDFNDKKSDAKNIDIIFKIILVIGILSFITGIGIFIYYQKESENISIVEIKDNNEVNNKLSIFVDISGAVNKPGLFEFNDDIRVSDVISKAEGFREDADREWIQKKLNLARKVKDQEKIYIPFKGEELNNYELKNDLNDNKININLASKEELMTLTKIGEVTANKIIEYRNGMKFTTINDLLKVDGIGENTLETIKDRIVVE